MKFQKPKFWDYKKPSFFTYLLLPFTLPLIINNFFLRSKKNITHSEIKKICVGNIYVGGTGKTPLVMKIYQILNNLGYKTSVIKKFYLNPGLTIVFNGDKYFSDNGLKDLLEDNNDIVIFDDGLQDRSIDYDLKFICFNNIKWIGNGFLIPAGPLREKIESISKFDVIFIDGLHEYVQTLDRDNDKNIKVFESHYIPTNIDQFDTTKKYIVFSGIGNPEKFFTIAK